MTAGAKYISLCSTIVDLENITSPHPVNFIERCLDLLLLFSYVLFSTETSNYT